MEIQIDLGPALAALDPARYQKALERTIERGSMFIRDHTKSLPPVSKATTGYGPHGIPVATGRMRQAIQRRKLSLLAAEVGAYVNYSEKVHDTGEGSMPARPFFEWGYEEFGGREGLEKIAEEEITRATNAQS